MAVITVGSTEGREALVAELRRVSDEIVRFFEALDESCFVAPLGLAWSPADNVRHLRKSVQPVAQAFGLPRLVPRLLFGAARRPSRDFATLVADYRGVLADGGTAGRFAPPPQQAPADVGAWRLKLLNGLARENDTLATRATAWSEDDLDRHRLPHPLLGKLTAREMLFFTLYHGIHHTENVRRRLAG